MKYFWDVVYLFYPKFLRLLEKTGLHGKRQDFLIGTFNANLKVSDLETYLVAREYHHGVLSWKDPGEILNLRKLEGKLYQYHIRVFDDGEVRAHYEYSSESRPLQHVLESHFEPRHEYFQELLGEYLIPIVR